MKLPAWAESVPGLEALRRNLSTANRVLLIAIPVVALLGVADIGRARARTRWPMLPIVPNLEQIHRPLAEIPSPMMQQTQFHAVQPSKPVSSPAQVIVKDAQWKLKGVMMKPSKRAMLEDSEGRTVWVTEGEQVGVMQVVEIQERAIIVEEAGGKSYEIRM